MVFAKTTHKEAFRKMLNRLSLDGLLAIIPASIEYDGKKYDFEMAKRTRGDKNYYSCCYKSRDVKPFELHHHEVSNLMHDAVINMLVWLEEMAFIDHYQEGGKI